VLGLLSHSFEHMRLLCYKHKMLYTDDKECCNQRDSQCIYYRWSIVMMYMLCVSHSVSLIVAFLILGTVHCVCVYENTYYLLTLFMSSPLSKSLKSVNQWFWR